MTIRHRGEVSHLKQLVKFPDLSMLLIPEIIEHVASHPNAQVDPEFFIVF